MRSVDFKLMAMTCASCLWATTATAETQLNTWFNFDFPTSYGVSLGLEPDRPTYSLGWADSLSFDWSQTFGLKSQAVSAKIEPLRNLGSSFVDDFWDFAKDSKTAASGTASHQSSGFGFGILFVDMDF